MADQNIMTDEELAAELREYGEIIQLPIKANKKHILIKKLNHLRARAKSQESPINKSKRVSGTGKKGKSPAPALHGPGADDITDSYGAREVAATNTRTRRQLNSHVPSKPVNEYPRTRSRLNPNLGTLSSDSDSDDNDDEEQLLQGQAQGPFKSQSSSNTQTHTQKFYHQTQTPTYSDRKRTSQFSDSILRTIRRRTGENLQTPSSSRQNTRSSSNEVFELSAEEEHRSQPLRDHDGSVSMEENDTALSPARRLYPDLKKLTSYLTNSHGQASVDHFESSDSDIDGSSYEVENKSVNTSFPVHNKSFSFSQQVNNQIPATSFRQQQSVVPRRRFVSGQRVQQYKSAFTEHLPHFFVGLAILFFIALSVTYAMNHRNTFFSWFMTSNNIGSGDELLLCPDGQPPGLKCYDKGEIDRSLGYISTLFAQLSAKKGEVLCETQKAGYEIMTVSALEDKIWRETLSRTTADRIYKCCLDHILANPHWNIRALKEDGSVAKSAVETAKLESTVATMGFWCRFRRSFATVLYGLFFLFITIFGVMLASMYVKNRLKQKEQEQREMFAMVEKIIDILQEHHEQTKGEDCTEPSYLAVQHVRDQLLPPAQRRKLQPIWERAFEFIASNESRIRLETRLIHGDEFEVWHWLPPTSHNGKIWQGQAFGENNESNSNQRMYSPTPCLKIRNMFDSNVESEDHWESNVVDAILEKLKNIEHVIHIFVDTESREGCVYLKCSSLEAAGKARLALHGWWFDGRLVTVKHLKLDHYHKRWPEALRASKPLRPSTNQMLSLSQPYYRSSLELT